MNDEAMNDVLVEDEDVELFLPLPIPTRENCHFLAASICFPISSKESFQSPNKVQSLSKASDSRPQPG